MFGWPVMGIWQAPPQIAQDRQHSKRPQRATVARGATAPAEKKTRAPSSSPPTQRSIGDDAGGTLAAAYADVMSVRRNRGGADMLLVASTTGAIRLFNYPALAADGSGCTVEQVHAACASGADFLAGDQQVVSVCATDGSSACWRCERVVDELDEDRSALLRGLQSPAQALSSHATVTASGLWRAYAASLAEGKSKVRCRLFCVLNVTWLCTDPFCRRLRGVGAAVAWRWARGRPGR
jgi:hypothetical protein